MSTRAELLKSIVKGSDISEDASLDKYLLSRGINPKFATKDQKVAHSKTGEFIKWKQNHMLESVDKKDTVTMDIPLLIRVMELAREDIKSDMDLHRVVEKLINIRKKGMLTMKDYNYIAKIHEEIMPQIAEEVIEEATEQLDEISKDLQNSYYTKAYNQKYKNEPTKPTKLQLKNRNKGMAKVIKRSTNKITLPDSVAGEYAKHKPGQYVGDSVEHNDTPMVEAQSAALRFQKALQREKAKREEQERKDAESKARAEKLLNPQKPVSEADCGYSDIPAQDQGKKLIQMSKSARIIKSIYKRKGVAEAGNKPLEKSYIGTGDTRTPRELKTQMQGASDEFVRSTAGKKPGVFHSKVAHMQNKLAKSELRNREKVVAEGFDDVVKGVKRFVKGKPTKGERETHHANMALGTAMAIGTAGSSPELDKELNKHVNRFHKVKNLGNKGVTEETYDWEKDDKSTATYGKKPKISTVNPKKSMGENKPDAAAVLTGGTTLTGQPRDTIEIDPMMRKRPGPNIPGKNK